MAASDVKMKIPANGGKSMSFGGIACEADKDGNIDVPAQYVADAISHGLTPVAPVADKGGK